jgi:hypothetical protein
MTALDAVALCNTINLVRACAHYPRVTAALLLKQALSTHGVHVTASHSHSTALYATLQLALRDLLLLITT